MNIAKQHDIRQQGLLAAVSPPGMQHYHHVMPCKVLIPPACIYSCFATQHLCLQDVEGRYNAKLLCLVRDELSDEASAALDGVLDNPERLAKLCDVAKVQDYCHLTLLACAVAVFHLSFLQSALSVLFLLPVQAHKLL